MSSFSFGRPQMPVPENISGWKERCPNMVVPSAPDDSASYFGDHVCRIDERSQKVLTCWTPICASDVTTCIMDRFGKRLVFTNDVNAAVIDAGAIIDGIEFFGIDGFSTKDVFSIGLGQMNKDITFPLIVDAEPITANEKVGGCRDFLSTQENGKNDKNMVLFPSYVNVQLNQPITCGQLQVVVRYHLKIV